MLFYVVDPLIAQWPSAPVETSAFPDVPHIASVMWVPFPRSIDPDEMDAFIENSCPSFVLRSEVAIIGLHSNSASAVLRRPDVLDDLAERAENAPLLIVYHINGRPAIKHVRGPRVAGMESYSTLKKIRDRDIAAVIRRPGAELPKHPNIHYRGPNGDHYRAFLRPGLGVRSIEELDRISFWLGPLLSNKNNILVDHWSMIAVAYHAGQYAARERWTTGPICVQSVRAYNEELDTLCSRIKGTLGRRNADSGAILVSVNSSGRLIRERLLPAMRNVGFGNPDPVTVAISSTPPSGVPSVESLTILDEDFARHDPADCELCKTADAILIPIPDDTYLLNLSAHIHLTAIGKKHAEDSRKMVDRYRNIGAFKTHVTHSDGRHHAYFVDLLPMLNQDIFRRRAIERLGSWQDQDVDLIIHPGHAAASGLAAIVGRELRNCSVVVCDHRLHNLRPEDARLILEADRICIVDDVVISGSRLLGYRNSVNRFRRSSNRQDCELYCFVGVSRMPSTKALTAVSDMFRHGGHGQRFQSVEELVLPNWSEQDCRWCAELRLLNKLPVALRDLEFVDKRLDTLRVQAGLVRDLFPVWPTHSGTGSEYWHLGSGSIFGNVQGADLAVSVASAIQSMRGKRRHQGGAWLASELDEIFQAPIAKILDPDFFVSKRFYVPILKAAILRATRAHDMMAPGNDGELLGQLEILVKDQHFAGLFWELILAVSMDQLPRALLDMMPQFPPDLTDLVAAVLDSR